MDVYEKYYRRSFNAINRLTNNFKNGYSKKNIVELIKELLCELENNKAILSEERASIIYTIIIALLGLNKESIENTGKIREYKKATKKLNIRAQELDAEIKRRIEIFDNIRTKSTEFDEWLSIIKSVPTDTTNYEHLKRVRNALLHSNFYVDDFSPLLNIVHLKIKNYYEAEIIEPEFNAFMLDYFTNQDIFGLTDSVYLYHFPERDEIKNEKQLENYLKGIDITEINYKNIKNMISETPEKIISEAALKNGIVNSGLLKKQLFENSNFEFNINNCKQLMLEEIEKKNVIDYIKQKIGDSFFDYDVKRQKDVIMAYLDFMLNPKKEISGWLVKFWYLYISILSPNFSLDSFLYDEYEAEPCYPALLILKSYLIIYRLQNNNFSKIDYSKISFDINDSEVFVSEDTFSESFNVIKSKNDLSDIEAWNKVVCEVFRNSLAHGSVTLTTDLKNGNYFIEFNDKNPKKGTVRTIRFSIAKLEQFLKSDAFLPKNCYTRSNDVLVRNRDKK